MANEKKTNIKKFYQQAAKPANYVPNTLVTSSPAYPPTMSGLMHINPETKDIWISAGKELVSDWINVTSGGGGGGGTYTVSNGLTETPANNFKLGGALLEETVISAGSNALVISRTGVVAGFAPLGVYSDDPATAFSVVHFDSIGALSPTVTFGKTNTSFFPDEIILQLTSNQSGPVVGASKFINITKIPNQVNSSSDISFFFSGGTGALNSGNTNIISAKVYDISNNNYRADLEFFTSFGTAPVNPPNPARSPIITKKMSITGNGQLILDEYGSAAFNGAVSYLLAVDTSGNVKEVTTAGLTNAIDDAAAAVAGVPLNGIYRNGSVLQIRAN